MCNTSKIYLLNGESYEDIVSLPVIKINFFVKKIDLDPFDALIFTSKNGVRAIEEIDKSWREKEIYSIGQGTSKEVQKFGVTPTYTAKNSYGDSFAQEIKDRLINKKVLFLRAKVVTSKLNQILINENIDLQEEIIYETVCEKYTPSKRPLKNALIIFTSPSTIKCFLKNFDWDETYRAICIGEVTAKALRADMKNYISDTQTVLGCIELAKSHL